MSTALKCGDPVEITIAGSAFGNTSVENATFVGYDEDAAVVRLSSGKHKNINVGLVQLRGKPYFNERCPKCKNQGKWVDHGPAVGKGWYCTTCKDDIPSGHNTYGISGKQFVKPPLPKLGMMGTGFIKILNCGKDKTCTTCGGVGISTPPVDVKIGDEVECLVHAGSGLLNGHRYKVHAVSKDSVGIDIRGTVKNFSRCRFALVTHA